MGKKIVDEDMLLNIIINGNEGKNELFKLEEAMKDLNSEADKLERSIKKYEKTISSNEATLKRYQASLDKSLLKEEKLKDTYADARENLSLLNQKYKNLDATVKGGAYARELKAKMLEASEATRKLAAEGKKLHETNEGLRNKIKSLSRETETAKRKLDEETASLNKNRVATSKTAEDVKKLRSNLNITTLSIDELNKEITKTAALFRATDPNTPQWKAYQRQLIALRAQHEKLQSQGRATQHVLCRAADNINKYWNLLVSTFAGLIGVVMGIKSAINKYVEFTDVISDVQKTTNLAKEEVEELNEQLKKVNTRSAQEELMGLARIGGKLGIEGKENILGFVRAADQINVALKEDLGGDTEEAIRQVGKIVDIFKVNEEFGIEKGMLKVGSVVNELGMSSTANEGYIVEFTKRVAGIAPTTKVSVSSVMGLAATLDKFGQTSEVSSTVYSQVMTQMYKKTQTFARIAGMEVTAFSGLLKKDANEAFIRVMEGLKGNSAEIENMIASMGDMGMEGKRAVSVLGVLANNTATLREQQALANKAFEEGISLTNEFEVKNNNLAAKREKVKKTLDERIKQLGEKLYPLLTHGLSLFSRMIGILEVLVDFTARYGGKVVWLTSVLGAYWVMMNKNMILRKLEEALVLRAISLGMQEANGVKSLAAAKFIFTSGVKKATAAMKAFKVALMANPWTALATALAGVVSYLVFFVDWTNKAKKAAADCSAEIAKEQFQANRLFEAYKKTNAGTRERADVIKILQDKYGAYLKNMIDENGNLTDIAKAQKVVNEELAKSIILRMKDQAASEIASEKMKTYVKRMNNLRESLTEEVGKESADVLMQDVKNYVESGRGFSKLGNKFEIFGLKWNKWFKNVLKVGDPFWEMQYSLSMLDQQFDLFLNKTETKTSEDKNSNNGIDSSVPDFQEKPRDYDAEIILLKDRYAKRLIAREEYERKLDSLELAHLEYRLKNEDMSEEKRVELKQKIADKRLAIAEKARKKEEYIDSVIEADSPAKLKEEKAYKERLMQAGLFGVEREKMTEKQLQALAILEKQHADNCTKIEEEARKKRTDKYMKGIDDQIKNLQAGQAIEIAQLKTNQALELEGFSGSLYQRQELLKQHQKQLLELTEQHAEEMIVLLGDVFSKLEKEEFNLGESILTEEQKNELKKRLGEVSLALSGLKVTRKELDEKKKSEFDVLGMTSSQWEELINNLKNGKLGIEDMESAVGALSNAWSAYNQMRSAQGQKELKQYEQKTKKERAALDKQLDAGQISQEQYNARVSQLDADLDEKKEKLEKEQRKRERTAAIFNTILNTAVGVSKAWSLGLPIGPILAAIVAAMGVVQLATIKAAQYAKGKYPVVGSDDGKRYDADYVGNNIQTGVYEKPTLGLFSEKEPEMVIDGNTTRKLIFNYPQIYRSIIDVSRGGVPQYATGRYPSNIPDYNTTSTDMVSQYDPEVKQLLRENIRMMGILANKPVEIPWYGRGGIKEKMDKSAKYEQKTSGK